MHFDLARVTLRVLGADGEPRGRVRIELREVGRPWRGALPATGVDGHVDGTLYVGRFRALVAPLRLNGEAAFQHFMRERWDDPDALPAWDDLLIEVGTFEVRSTLEPLVLDLVLPPAAGY
jgi:hypothetical protein